MANFSVSPQGLTFNPAPVQGSIASIYAIPQTLTFVLKNTSGASVTITNYGFTSSTEGDAATQPVGIYNNSDFTVVPTAGSFPVTVANNATQSFTVTYAPLRRGSGFGDLRSQLVTLFQGYKALSNGGQVTNSSGEVVNFTLPQLVAVGVGGKVTEEAFDWATVAPIYQGSGNVAAYAAPAGYGDNSPTYRLDGMGANMTIADFDTSRHSVSAIPLYSGTAAGSTAGTTGVQVGARGVQVLVYGLDNATHFDLALKAYTTNPTNGLHTVFTWTGLNSNNIGGLFVGNAEGINLQGLRLAVTLSNVTNPNSVTIGIGVVVTG